MANLSNVRLEVGRINGTTEFARVTGVLSWGSRERAENLSYSVRTFLRERDGSRDTWNMLPDGGITRHERGDEDDSVGFIDSTSMRPNGQSSRPFELRRNFNFGNQEIGSEEYYAVATVVPEIRGDLALSNEVSANLG